jgi:hypothetical protein
VIQINRPVVLLLPFHRYRLRLSHRLLESLGGVSRFILRALADGLSMANLVDVTGLSAELLEKQLSFLEQHHFVSVDHSGNVLGIRLKERGVTLVEVDRRLHDWERTVWLDAFTLKRPAIHFLVTNDPTCFLRHPEDADFGESTVVQLPKKVHRYSHFDDYNRLRTLMSQDTLIRLLEYCWDGAAELIAGEFEHWEYFLDKQDNDGEIDYFPASFAPGELVISPHSGPMTMLPDVLLPILRMTLKFIRPESFPWPTTVPASSDQYLELISHGMLPAVEPGQDAESASEIPAVKIPDTVSERLPVDLRDIIVPPGLSVTLDVSRYHARCSIDYKALSGLLHRNENVLLSSFNYHEEK